MKTEFYKRMQKDIEEFEKKYPGQRYSTEVLKEHEEIKEKWKQQ